MLGVTILDDIVVVSLLLFWSMIETGMALVVACLPALQPLFRGLSPEAAIRSVRSKLSLRSMQSSNKSNAFKINDRIPDKSSPGVLYAFPPKGDHGNVGIEIYAMEDLPSSIDYHETGVIEDTV